MTRGSRDHARSTKGLKMRNAHRELVIRLSQAKAELRRIDSKRENNWPCKLASELGLLANVLE